MASRHPRATLTHQGFWAAVTQQGQPFCPQRFGRFKLPTFCQIQLEATVHCPWDMPAYGVHGFVLPRKTVGGAGIDQRKTGVVQIGQHSFDIHDLLKGRLNRKLAIMVVRHHGIGGQPCRLPCLPAAIQ